MDGTLQAGVDRAHALQRAALPDVLLVVPDAEPGERLLAACRAAMPGVRCIVCRDEVSAAFVVPSGGVELVVVEAALARTRGAGWLANLRRQIPRGRLLLVDARSPSQLRALGVSLPWRIAPRPGHQASEAAA